MKRTSENPNEVLLLLFVILICFMAAAPAQEIVFSSLLGNRETDSNAMAFNKSGDLYFIGSAHGLERALASDLPDGLPDDAVASTLIRREDYAQVFEPDDRMVVDINGAGIVFDRSGTVISMLEEVYMVPVGQEEAEASRLRFVRYDPENNCFDGVVFEAGETLAELGLTSGEPFDVDARDHPPLQMVLTDINGSERLLFTLWDAPVVFQATVPTQSVACETTLAGGQVTTFHRFTEEGFPQTLTVMERQGKRSLLAGHSNGNIYEMDFDNGDGATVVVEKPALLSFFGVPENEPDWGIYFVDLDYEPVSDRIYTGAFVPWYNPEIRTLIAISPDDGSALEKVFDEIDLTTELAGIRSPQNGQEHLLFNTVAVSPVAVAGGLPSLFLGDFWTGLYMVRADLTLPLVLTPAEQMLNALDFFNDSLVEGSMYRINAPRLWPNIYIEALRSTMRYAYVILDRGYLDGPSGQYWHRLLCSLSIPYLVVRTDGDANDYVGGSAVPEFNAMIRRIGGSLGCPL